MGFVTVRRAGGADVPSMYGIYTNNLDEYISADAIEFFMLQWPRGQLVAEAVTGGMVGSLSSFIMDDSSVSVALLAVDAPFRGMGAGSALIDRIISAAIAMGAPTLRLEVRVTNTSAIEFYERRGFRKTEIARGIYCDGGDAFRMVLDLTRVSAGSTPQHWRR